ncbi:MAG: ribonuclease J, partial [Syntrophales bacterium]
MTQKQPQRPRRFHPQPKQWQQPDKKQPPQPTKRANRPGVLRIIPLGGLEEVGRNSMVFEYGNDIIIIDLGLQFPEDDMPGIDYSIPNISYLKGKERNIRGIIVTHGHYDHIGGIPHLAPKLGNPPIYSSDLTLAMVQKKQEDIDPKHKLRLIPVKTTTRLKLGAFQVEFMGLSHNIPASFGVILTTPLGTVVHTGDFKIDRHGEAKNETEFQKIEALKRRGVLALLCDSTNAPQVGEQLSERDIQGDLEKTFTQADGRMIFATFASLLSRIQQIIQLAEKYDRKVLIEGYSMKTNVEIGQRLGYLKINKGTLIKPQDMKRYPSRRLLILSTGAQG